MKKNVYLSQVNNSYGRAAWLPYSVGLLQAYAQKNVVLKTEYDFKEMFYLREPIADVIKRMETPDVFGVSAYIWNWSYSTALAKAVKKTFPECLIVFGGPHVPNKSEDFFKDHSYIDLLVHYEGEATFSDVLLQRLSKQDYRSVHGLSIRNEDNTCLKTLNRERMADINDIPSPYTSGVFDPILNRPFDYTGTSEPDRGCPYSCTFSLFEGALVHTNHGFVSIKHLVENQQDLKVYTSSKENAARIVLSPARHVCKTAEGKRLIRIRWDDGGIDCTPDHKFPIASWELKEAWDLVPGIDRIWTYDPSGFANLTLVLSVERLPGLHDVYDLEVPETGLFFCNNALTKNCDWGSNLLAKMKKFSEDRIIAEFEWFAKNKLEFIFCLAEGTLINTVKGPCPIEDVEPGTDVFCWDEEQQKLSTSYIQESVCTGTKEVWGLTHEEGYIEATTSHRIYTRRGWKTIEETIPGDEVLCNLQYRNECKTYQKDLLPRVPECFEQVDTCSEESRSKESIDRQETSEWLEKETEKRDRDSIREWNIQRITQGYTQEETRKRNRSWQSREDQTTPQGRELRCNVCYAERRWESLQQNDARGTTGEQKEDGGSKKSSRLLVAERGIKPYEYNEPRKPSNMESRLEGEDAKILGRSGLGCCSFRKSWEGTEFVRAEDNEIPRGQSTPISIHRGLQSLDSNKNWEEQEPRLCSCYERNQQSDSCSWEALAPGSGGSRRGDKRLCKHRLGSISHMGRRQTDRGFDREDQNVCWSKITSIVKIGVKKVYDLINVRKYHNFFANGILVHNSASANWGLFERDVELTRQLVKINERYQYPKKFRYTSAKNSGDRVYTIAKMLHDAGMNKGATLSFQSMDENTLTLIKRKNIGIDVFKKLMARYRDEGISTYSELICGLPGETYDTWSDGLDSLLRGGQHHSLHCYHVEVLPNSELNNPAYKKEHGIKTTTVPVRFFHGTPSGDGYPEWYELVIETKSMPSKDWIRSSRIAWLVQCAHCLALTQSIAVFSYRNLGLSYRRFYELLLKFGDNNPNTIFGEVLGEYTQMLEDVFKGEGLGIVDDRFGNIMWPPEEGGFLKLAVEKDRFYQELIPFVESLFDSPLAADLIKYQETRTFDPYRPAGEYSFGVNWNIHEYLEATYRDESIELVQEPREYIVTINTGYGGDLETWSREAVWRGRKGSIFLHPVKVSNSELCAV